MTTGKTIAFTRWTFVGKVMSLFFSMLSRLVIVFLLRSNHLLMLCMLQVSTILIFNCSGFRILIFTNKHALKATSESKLIFKLVSQYNTRLKV